MNSAFGVDHGEVAKSFVGGKAVRAMDLTRAMRAEIKDRTRVPHDYPLPQGEYIPGRKIQGQHSKGRQLYSDEHEVRSMKRKISTGPIESPHHKLVPTGEQLLGMSRPNGKGGGILRMNLKAPNQDVTYAHEMAHLKPKRNPARFFERIGEDQRKLGREEGRADFIGNKNKKTPGNYPGSEEFQRGYNEVQHKMAGSTGSRARKARQRPRFAVDSKGTATVKKSFVNGKFVSAIELSAKEASKVRSGGQWKKARGVTEKDSAFRDLMTSPEVKQSLKDMNGVKRNKYLPKDTGSGGTIRAGSKSHGRSYVAGEAGSKKEVAQIAHHEAQHANPKRSSYRLHSQIMGDPKKLFREEARADWASAGHYNQRNNQSAYAIGARAQSKILEGKGKKTFKLPKEATKAVKQAGVRSPTNNQMLRHMYHTVDANTPHYKMAQGNGKKAVGAYRKLQDDFQRRGVNRP